MISPGARAEPILVAGNPFDDLSILRHPRRVMMDGQHYIRDALDLLHRSRRSTMSTYATIWLTWYQLTEGARC